MKIIEWFLPEEAFSSDEELIRGRLLVVICFVMSFLSLVTVVFRWWLHRKLLGPMWVGVGCVVMFGLVPFLYRRTHRRRVGWIPSGFLFVALLGLSYKSYGLYNVAMPVVLVLPILSVFTMDACFARLMSILSVLAMLVFAVSHAFGGYEPAPVGLVHGHYILRAFIYIAGVVFLAVLVSFYEFMFYRTKSNLLLSEERYVLALQGARDGIYDWDLAGGKSYLSPRFQELLGFAKGELDGREPFSSELFDPKEVGRIKSALETCLREHGPFDLECRMKTASGSLEWFHVRGGLHILDDKPVRMVGSIRDISERKQLEQMQEEFISNMSHEFRTPLTSIMGSLKLLEKDVVFSASQRRSLLQIAGRNSERLLTLVNDLLDLQKLQVGLVPLSCTWVDVEELAKESIDLHLSLGAKRGILLDLECEEALAPIWADPGRLHQVLSNLLANAIKHSPEQSNVTVRVRRSTNGAVLEVEDRGPGIPEAFQTHLFERFARWDEANQPQGTGLGLAISKRITEAHGGRISFETVPHERTCFTVELPMRKPQEDGDMDWLGAEEEGGASGVSVEC